MYMLHMRSEIGQNMSLNYMYVLQYIFILSSTVDHTVSIIQTNIRTLFLEDYARKISYGYI